LYATRDGEDVCAWLLREFGHHQDSSQLNSLGFANTIQLPLSQVMRHSIGGHGHACTVLDVLKEHVDVLDVHNDLRMEVSQRVSQQPPVVGATATVSKVLVLFLQRAENSACALDWVRVGLLGRPTHQTPSVHGLFARVRAFPSGYEVNNNNKRDASDLIVPITMVPSIQIGDLTEMVRRMVSAEYEEEVIVASMAVAPLAGESVVAPSSAVAAVAVAPEVFKRLSSMPLCQLERTSRQTGEPIRFRVSANSSNIWHGSQEEGAILADGLCGLCPDVEDNPWATMDLYIAGVCQGNVQATCALLRKRYPTISQRVVTDKERAYLAKQ